MVGYLPTGRAPRMTASPLENASSAAWHVEQSLRNGHVVFSEQAAPSVGGDTASAAAAPPQLHHYLPGSRDIYPRGAASSPILTAVVLPVTEPVKGPGAAAAVPKGEAAPLRVDNRGREPLFITPAPPPADAVQNGYQTAWSLASRLRKAGDAKVTEPQHTPCGYDQFGLLDDASFGAPCVPFSSPPRRKPTTLSSARAAGTVALPPGGQPSL
eukprot:TRINITY_DN6849_c0_g2_i1.p1 TRINITY_DN6849_c0_g2~~TRINITY_DN6849_c0_g2_i1.p1  ORF type:complete len:213 (+),score=17.02 TRINITY_DN6849_c0_g2_i1:868-1506(+)